MNAIPPKQSALWLALALSLALPWGVASQANPEPAQPAPMPMVFNTERPSKTDLVVFDTGEKRTGTVLNETLTLRTAYGPLHLEKRWVAGISLAAGSGNLDCLVTVNSNRFTGLLETPSFSFLPETGSRIDLRREKVALLIFGLRDGDPPATPIGRWFGLRNGDRLSGRLLLPDPVPLKSSQAQAQVKWPEVATLVFPKTNSPLARCILRAGGTLEGTIAVEDFPVQLDAGFRIELYRNTLAWIGDSREGGSAVETPSHSAVDPGPSSAMPSPGTNSEELVWIPAGEFIMGSPSDEAGRNLDEGPQTKVILPHGFWLSRCEVTQAEYQRVMGSNPSNTTDDPNQPVEKVTWYEAMEYCSKLTRQDQTRGRLPAGFAYRLPTEAEWEYACRAGTKTRFSFGDDKTETQLADYAWFLRNSESTPHPVGKKQPNPWGLFDMHGNVWEWCLDRWESALPGVCVTNTPVAADGTLRVARGGSWLYDGRACRSADRDDYSPSNRCSDLGFRVALAPVAP